MNAEQRRTILIVDDNKSNLMTGKEILKKEYKVLGLESAKTMFEILKNVRPDLILLDVEMPEMDGYEAIKHLKAQRCWADIPVIFLTAKSDEGSELKGLSLGAVDYIRKPFSGPLLLKRLENHLLMAKQKAQLSRLNESLLAGMLKKNQEVVKMHDAILRTVADLVECRDDMTGGHITRVQKFLELLLSDIIEKGIYSDITARWDMDHVLSSAQLHDVGKIGISDAILLKPGKLTSDEFEIMKTHVIIGVESIKHITELVGEHAFMTHARLFAETHHEKWDGTGYPNSLSGMDIPLEGRLLAIADVYDALASKRPYKNSFTPEVSYQIIVEGAGKHFDPALVDVFMKLSEKFAKIAREES